MASKTKIMVWEYFFVWNNLCLITCTTTSNIKAQVGNNPLLCHLHLNLTTINVGMLMNWCLSINYGCSNDSSFTFLVSPLSASGIIFFFCCLYTQHSRIVFSRSYSWWFSLRWVLFLNFVVYFGGSSGV